MTMIRADLLTGPDWIALERLHPNAYEFMRQRGLRAELRVLLKMGILWDEEHARMQQLSLMFPEERSDNWRWRDA